MELTGIIGTDWLKPTTKGKVKDADLRLWRDHLEEQLQQALGLSSDFTIGDRTRFVLAKGSEHTVIEIESFARKALDRFLDKMSAK